MNAKPGRNDPCPCGSGKKYKQCCMEQIEATRSPQPATQYRFEPGSYGDKGNFMPSLANLKLVGEDQWEYHFVLIKPDSLFEEEDSASAMATHDMDAAYASKQTGGDAAVALALRGMGYVNVQGFNIVADKNS